MLGVIYHAERRDLSNKKSWRSTRLTRHSNAAQNLFVGEISSILVSSLCFFPSLDQPIRAGEHLRRNRQTDLLGCFQIDYELELRWLLDW